MFSLVSIRSQIADLNQAATEHLFHRRLTEFHKSQIVLGELEEARNKQLKNLLTGNTLNPTEICKKLWEEDGIKTTPQFVNCALVEMGLQTRERSEYGSHHCVMTPLAIECELGVAITIGKLHTVKWDACVLSLVLDHLTKPSTDAKEPEAIIEVITNE